MNRIFEEEKTYSFSFPLEGKKSDKNIFFFFFWPYFPARPLALGQSAYIRLPAALLTPVRANSGNRQLKSQILGSYRQLKSQILVSYKQLNRTILGSYMQLNRTILGSYTQLNSLILRNDFQLKNEIWTAGGVPGI